MAKKVKKEPRTYYRKDGYVFVADHVVKHVSVPRSVEEEDYPQEILDHIKKDKYFKQLTIE